MCTARFEALLGGFSTVRSEYRRSCPERFASLLDAFAMLRAGARRTRFNGIAGLLQDYGAVLQRVLTERRPIAPAFSLFEVLGREADELSHSRVLAWVLDPRSSHSQGPLFFRAMCRGLQLGVEFEGWDYKVSSEHPELESRIDVAVYGRHFLVYIENKVGAEEGPDQTLRESRDMERLAERLRVPPDSCWGLYLSPRPAQVAAPEFRSVTWSELTEVLEPAVAEVPADEVRCFLRQWLKTLRKIGGGP